MNLYVTDISTIYKLSSDGRRIWEFPCPWPNGFTACPSLGPGNQLYGRSVAGYNFALDLQTGSLLWATWTGLGSGDTSYVENHEGVIISEHDPDNNRVVAIRAEDGGQLWSFSPDSSVWNLMPLFPGDGTVVFQDIDARVYKLGLHNGTLLWKNGGGHQVHKTWSDGGCMIGPNNMVYAASSKGLIAFHHPTVGGGVHAYRLDTGELAWQKHLERPFFSWPVVGKLPGREKYSVIVAIGANAFHPWQIVMLGNILEFMGKGRFLLLLVIFCGCCVRGRRRKDGKRVRCSCTRCVLVLGVLFTIEPAITTYMYSQGLGGAPFRTFEADIFAFDAETGEQQWVHHLPAWPYVSAAGDGDGFFERAIFVPSRSVCLPASFNAPTIDARGTVWIGYMSGMVLGLRDENMDGVVTGDAEVQSMDTKAAFLHSGPAFAPGLMAVTNCDSLWVWKT